MSITKQVKTMLRYALPGLGSLFLLGLFLELNRKRREREAYYENTQTEPADEHALFV